MKILTRNFYIKSILPVLLLTGCYLLNSCRDDERAAPVITDVRLVDPTKKDSTFTQAFPGTTVVVEG
ncbi:MAG TPA: hypothetical protein VIN08_04185 [Ohtaekwangia sp.]|uniref:hypothetical protein n=1 Tax=Ohtaekwangia sp. TaxID=2066019 RepID=UPI002F9386A6